MRHSRAIRGCEWHVLIRKNLRDGLGLKHPLPIEIATVHVSPQEP